MKRLIAMTVLSGMLALSGCCQKEPEKPAVETPKEEESAQPALEEKGSEPKPEAEPEEEASDFPPAEVAGPEVKSPATPVKPPKTETEVPETPAEGGRTVQKGDKVKVLYRGTLEDGSEFDSSAKHGNKPLEFEVGARQMIQGFDEAVVGMKVGEKKTVHIPAEKAYGPRHEQAILNVPKEQIPAGTDLSPGATIVGRGPRGLMRFTVVEVQGDAVVLDGNHPLAGKDLDFEIEMVEVTPGEGAIPAKK